MGWDEVVIGKGKSGNSAITVFAIPGDHSVSESSAFYWATTERLRIGATIFKNSEEGSIITKMIHEKYPPEKIHDYIEQIVIQHAGWKVLSRAIEAYANYQFQQGRDSKRDEIRSALESR